MRFMASPSRRPITINAISWARKTTSEGPLAISAARASVIATTLNVTSALSRISSISSRRCATDQHLHIRVSFQAYSANASSDKLGRESLPAGAAIRTQYQSLRRNVFQRLSNQPGNLLRHLHLQRSMADDTDTDLLVLAQRGSDFRNLCAVVVRRLEGNDVNVEAIEIRQCRFVRVARLDALRQ